MERGGGSAAGGFHGYGRKIHCQTGPSSTVAADMRLTSPEMNHNNNHHHPSVHSDHQLNHTSNHLQPSSNVSTLQPAPPAAGSAAPDHHHATAADTECIVREQDRFMPIANVIRIMRKILPPHAKISDDAKETIQECVSEYISFITGEANERCQREQRKTITAEDVLWAMSKLGFDDYIEPLTLYLHRYRELEAGDRGAIRTTAHEPQLMKRAFDFGTTAAPLPMQQPSSLAAAFAPQPLFHMAHHHHHHPYFGHPQPPPHPPPAAIAAAAMNGFLKDGNDGSDHGHAANSNNPNSRQPSARVVQGHHF